MKQNLRTKFFYGPFSMFYTGLLSMCGHKGSIKHFLERLDFIHPNSEILEAGCGSGAVSISLAELYPNSRIIAFDYSKAMLKKARGEANKRYLRNVKFLRGNIESINPLIDENNLELILKEESFDTVLVSGALEHVSLERSLSELLRFLKKDGYFIDIGVKKNWYGVFQSIIMGFKIHTTSELKKEFQKAGLNEVREISLTNEELYDKLSKIVLIAKK